MTIDAVFRRLGCVLILLGLAVSLPATARAADTLRVGITETAPFVFKGVNGSWEGITIELWNSVASELGLGFHYQVYNFRHELEAAVEARAVDIALSDFALSRSHQDKFDYSRTYFHSDLSIAGHAEEKSIAAKVFDSLVSPTVLAIIGVLFVLVMFGAVIFWALEKHNNSLLYNKQHGRGNFSNGIMWAILLITAQEPDIFKNNSFIGRIVAMLLLFVGVTVSASYIALITSTLTLHQITTSIHDEDDLPYIRIAALHNSRASDYLNDRYLNFRAFDKFEEMMDALGDSEVDAVVADETKIQFYIRSKADRRVAQLPAHLGAEYFAFVFPKGSDLPHLINPAISDAVEDALWPDIVRRYIGEVGHRH